MATRRIKTVSNYIHDGMEIFDPEDDAFFQTHGRHRKSKMEYPYSYDPFTKWRKLGATHCSGTMYTDRMSSWWPSMREVSKEIFTEDNQWGQRIWDFERDPTLEKTSKLISKLMGKECEVVRIDEHCNVATGYPVWLIFFLEKGDKKPYKMTEPGC